MAVAAKSLEERFWPKVDKNGPVVREDLGPCWVWTAARSTGGYGKIGLSRAEGSDYAHRVAYRMANGPVPEGLMVLHRCDNRACVRAGHLFLGTARDNTQDMLTKGRGIHSQKQTCPYGHPYDAIRPGGGRRCSTCTLDSSRKHKARLRVLGTVSGN